MLRFNRQSVKQWLTEEGLLKLESWARDGLTDEQIAANMGITPKTLYRWKDQYCQICQSLKRGKEVVDVQVENALLKRALGYTYDEVTRERVLGNDQTQKIMTGSYNETLSTNFSKGVRNTIQEIKADSDKIVYSDIFPNKNP